jgi:hypothetical protein
MVLFMPVASRTSLIWLGTFRFIRRYYPGFRSCRLRWHLRSGELQPRGGSLRRFWIRFFIDELPFQLRRNREPLRQGRQPAEKLGSFLARHGQPHLDGPPPGNPIRSNQKDPFPQGPQPALKPTVRQHRLAEARQQGIQHTAAPKGGIRGVERLETHGVQAEILFEFLDAGFTVGPARIHPRNEFGGIGHRGDHDAIGVARTLDEPASPSLLALAQGLAETDEPAELPPPCGERGLDVGHLNARGDAPPVGVGDPLHHHPTYHAGEAGHDDVRQVLPLQRLQKRVYK